MGEGRKNEKGELKKKKNMEEGVEALVVVDKVPLEALKQ